MPTFSIAYFSMEVALESDMPTYSGGLGVLAGDTLRAAADLRLSMVGVTLAHRAGYFRQHLDAGGHQSQSPALWKPEDRLEPVAARAGWAIGEDGGQPSDPAREPESLYSKLESVIAPMLYRRPLAYAEVMRGAISLNGSFFNAQRKVIQYLRNAYLPGNEPAKPDPLIPALAPYLSGPVVGSGAPA